MWIPTTHNRHRYSKACGGVKELPGAFRSLCSSLAQPKFLVTLKSSGSGEKHLRWKEEGGRRKGYVMALLIHGLRICPVPTAGFCSFSASACERKGEPVSLHITHIARCREPGCLHTGEDCAGIAEAAQSSGQRSLGEVVFIY